MNKEETEAIKKIKSTVTNFLQIKPMLPIDDDIEEQLVKQKQILARDFYAAFRYQSNWTVNRTKSGTKILRATLKINLNNYKVRYLNNNTLIYTESYISELIKDNEFDTFIINDVEYILSNMICNENIELYYTNS
jgi:predicted nucleotidyltransferase